MARSGIVALTAALASASVASAASCDTSTLNTTTYLWPVTEEGTTIASIAAAANRGLCNVARYNFMADESIIPNVGQSIVIPPEVCPDEIDDTSCVIDNYNSTKQCLMGGPRLYYTVNQDTYAKIANRLDLDVDVVANGANASAVLEAGQFVKVPLCSPSMCSYEPFQFDETVPQVYKDLADEYGATVGQFMMLSPTYNYSQSAYTGQSPPVIDLPFNCTALSSNVTIIT
ncbi:hypothetical protein N0V93_009433 [Gnomoniopsis smithogilvyi]|uniref:LysM domain-containing protein n=1 Tax=Gnomoniopsis smithogilvyi TaxID=1191159 RepID=A0A9W8YL32_9PEZI|nr:hypothetical protein N0V93_009433 [Gnomoniopsis smithogilvyi]